LTFGLLVRIAAVVVAAPFLLGLLDGSLVVPAAALVAAGCARLADRESNRVFQAAAALVFGGAVAVGAARWEVFSLEDLRGLQAVLGPSVAVGPEEAAAALALAAGAGAVSLGLWLGAPRRAELWTAEAVTASLLLVTVFGGAALPGLGAPGSFGRLLLWVGSTLAVMVVGISIAAWSADRGWIARWGLLAGAVLVTSGAAVLLDRAL